MQCMTIGIGIDGDGGDTGLGTGAYDADCDFAAIGNEDFFYQVVSSWRCGRGF
jgi:hypothetical protein